MSRWPDGFYSVDDVVRLRDTPGVVDQTILAVTQQDGRGVKVAYRAADRHRRRAFQDVWILSEVSWRATTTLRVKPTGEKSVTLASRLSVQAEGGNVWLADRRVERSVCARAVRLAGAAR